MIIKNNPEIDVDLLLEDIKDLQKKIQSQNSLEIHNKHYKGEEFYFFQSEYTKYHREQQDSMLITRANFQYENKSLLQRGIRRIVSYFLHKSLKFILLYQERYNYNTYKAIEEMQKEILLQNQIIQDLHNKLHEKENSL